METKSKSRNRSLFQLVAGPLLQEVHAVFEHEQQADYLLASNLKRQVWHFWLHTSRAEPSPDAAPHLIYTKSKILVAEALHELGINDECPGLLNALGKLGPFALAEQTYQNLCEVLLERGKGSKLIMHHDVLTSEVIDRLHLLPDVLRREKIVFEEELDIENLELISFILRRKPGLISHLDHVDITDARRILSILFEQIRKSAQSDRLPIAWEGNNTVRPVGSLTELERLAAGMKNCLARYWGDLHTGTRSLFVLVGEAPVAICFKKLPGLGWELEEVRGHENRLPTRSEYQRIRSGFLSRPEFFIPKEHLVQRLSPQIDYAMNNMLHGEEP